MEPITLIAVGSLALLVLPFVGRKKARRSSALLSSGTTDSMDEGGSVDVLGEDGTTIDVDDATWAKVGALLGAGYRWGGGTPSTTIAEAVETGVDCAGSVQVAEVALGNLSPSAPDRGAVDLANASDPVPVGSQRPGDIAVYRRRHVMLVVSYPRADIGDHSHVFGASGGDQTTQGYDPSAPGYKSTARVKLYRTAKYRKDFLCYARLRT